MKNKPMRITSLPTGVASLTIRNGGRKSKPRRFAGIDEALEFAVLAGNRQFTLDVNGFEFTPYARVA